MLNEMISFQNLIEITRVFTEPRNSEIKVSSLTR
jgi:hypothetical protein